MWITVRQYFHCYWILSEILLVKQATELNLVNCPGFLHQTGAIASAVTMIFEINLWCFILLQLYGDNLKMTLHMQAFDKILQIFIILSQTHDGLAQDCSKCIADALVFSLALNHQHVCHARPLTLKRLGHFFSKLILFSNLVHHKCNIFIWNWSNTMNV